MWYKERKERKEGRKEDNKWTKECTRKKFKRRKTRILIFYIRIYDGRHYWKNNEREWRVCAILSLCLSSNNWFHYFIPRFIIIINYHYYYFPFLSISLFFSLSSPLLLIILHWNINWILEYKVIIQQLSFDTIEITDSFDFPNLRKLKGKEVIGDNLFNHLWEVFSSRKIKHCIFILFLIRFFLFFSFFFLIIIIDF